MRKIYFLSCALFLLMSSNVNAIPFTRSDSIQSLLKGYKYREALALIDKTIEEGQSSGEMYLLQGNVLRGMYLYDGALTAYLKGLSLDSTDQQLLIETAVTYKQIQDYQNALRYFSKVLAKDTTNLLMRLECANCKFLNEQYVESNTDFMKIYQDDTLNYFAIKRLGVGFSKVNQIDTSIYFFRKAIALKNNDASNITNLCNLYISKDNYTDGIKVTEEYERLDSSNAKVNSINAYLYMLNKQYDTAAFKFNKCIALKDTSRFVIKNLGISYFKQERYDTAKYWLEKAYFMDTTDINNLQFLGLACTQSYYKKLGIFYLEKAITQYGPILEEYATIYRNLAEAYRSWSKSPCEKTLEVSLKAYELNPKDTLLALFIGIGYDECKKDYRKAIEFYKIYLKSKPPLNEQNKLITLTYSSFENRVKVLKEYLKKE